MSETDPPRQDESHSTRRYTNDRLGRLAQAHVRSLCEAGGLNGSESNPDLDGWDFQFSVPRPRPLDGSSFFDTDPARTAAFVQVKATSTSNKHLDVALSHWLYAISTPMPWLFVVLEYEANEHPERMYVVHVDQAIVESVQRRLREAGAATTTPELHRMTMRLSWDETHRVEYSGAGLRQALISNVGEDMQAYAATKGRWRSEAGSDTVRNTITFRLRGAQAEVNQRLADWALGITESIRVDEMTRVEEKWDVPRTFDTERDVIMSFSAPSSIGSSVIRLRSHDWSEQAEFTAAVHSNVSILPFLPEELWALRFVWGFLSIIVRRGNRPFTVRISIPPDQPPIPLAELETLTRVLRLLRQRSVMTYRIPKYGGDQNFVSDLYPAIQTDGDIGLFAALDIGVQLGKLFALNSEAQLSPKTLESDAAVLKKFLDLNVSDDVIADIKTAPIEGAAAEEPRTFLFFPAVQLGEYVLTAVGAVTSPTEVKDGAGIVSGRVRILRRWTVPGGEYENWLLERLPGLLLPLVTELEKDQVVDVDLPDEVFSRLKVLEKTRPR